MIAGSDPNADPDHAGSGWRHWSGEVWKAAAPVTNSTKCARRRPLNFQSNIRDQEAAGSSPATPTMSSVHNATEHSYVKEQSKGCSFTISMELSAPMERLRLLHFSYPALPTRYSTATPWRLSSTTLSGYSSTSGISTSSCRMVGVSVFISINFRTAFKN